MTPHAPAPAAPNATEPDALALPDDVDELRRLCGDLMRQNRALARELAERTDAGAALARSERLLREAQETARLGYYVTDIATGVWEASPTMNEIFGIDDAYPHDIPHWNELLHPADAPGGLEHYVWAVTNHQPFRYDYRVVRPCDGEVRWVAAYGGFEYADDGTPLRLLGCIQDITDRKRAEERIEAQAALLDLAQDAITVRDLEGRVSYWNKGGERLTGYTAAEAEGRPIEELVRPDPATMARARQDVAAKGYWYGEIGLTTKAGRSIVVTSHWTLVRDDAGAPGSVLVIETDVTEQKRLETQFLRAQRLESIGVLAAGVAHDLNNILTPILISACLLADAPSREEVDEAARRIEQSAVRGANIVRQLLTYGRGVSGDRTVVNVGTLARDVAAIGRETFPRDIAITCDLRAPLPLVLGDATQLHQLLLNLCINARDAMAGGGALRIAASGVVADEAFLAMSPEAKPGAYVRVEVTDTGVGISAENLERIFDPFFTTKELGKGTGLGLFTVSAIVRSHGGFLVTRSTPGSGTTFLVFLPAASDADVRTSIAPGSVDLAGTGELVLVVDDEAEVRAALRATLERHGYRVVTACDGLEALALHDQHGAAIRAVVTDVMMPGMDGVALVGALRRRQPDLPIAVSSGLDDTARPRLRALGVERFLSKPYDASALLQAVRALLEPRPAP